MRKAILVMNDPYKKSLENRDALIVTSIHERDVYYSGVRIHFERNAYLVLLVLLSRTGVKKLTSAGELLEILYGDRADGGPLDSYGSINIAVYKVRRLCRKFGMDVTNVHGIGWELCDLRSKKDDSTLCTDDSRNGSRAAQATDLAIS